MKMNTYELNTALTTLIQQQGYDLEFTAIVPAVDGIVMRTPAGDFKWLYWDRELVKLPDNWREAL